jgi:replicative DNA helicase
MADPAAERTLPFDLEAERAVLGAILLQNEALFKAAESLRAEHFYREAHRRVFAAMLELFQQSCAIDLITLRDLLARQALLEAIGGAAYLASLVDGVPRHLNVEHYARIVRDKAVLRRLISSGQRMVEAALEQQEDPADLLDRAEKAIFEIAGEQLRQGFVPLAEITQSTFKQIERFYQEKSTLTGLPTGFVDLDAYTSGLQPSEYIVVAARPSMGKTSLCLNIAQNIAGQGYTVAVFSLEMSKEQLAMRMLCSEARINAHQLRIGALHDKELDRIIDALDRLSNLKIFIDDTPAITVLEVRTKARRLKLEHGLDLVILDYMQLMRTRERFENRNQEVSFISQSLKALAKELKLPVVALSQLSRAPEARREHRPQLADLRESGAIEQDADLVAFIYRPELYEPTQENEGLAELIIEKQRNGPTGTVKLAFLKEYTRFENLAFD